MKTTTPLTSAHRGHPWATGVADALLTRAAAAVEQARATHALRTELERGVATEGQTFTDRIEGELQSIAAAFNGRLGRPLLDVMRSLAGAVSIRSRHDGSYTLFVPSLHLEDGNEPGITVTSRQFGRDRVDPYRFALHNERLHVLCAGAVMGAEQFCRAQLEGWLLALPLGGR